MNSSSPFPFVEKKKLNQYENFSNHLQENKENIIPKGVTFKNLSRTPLQDITNTFKFNSVNSVIPEIENENYQENNSGKKISQPYSTTTSTIKKSGKKTEFRLIR